MRNRKDTVSTFRHLCPTLCATIRSLVVGDQQVGRFFFRMGFLFSTRARPPAGPDVLVSINVDRHYLMLTRTEPPELL